MFDILNTCILSVRVEKEPVAFSKGLLSALVRRWCSSTEPACTKPASEPYLDKKETSR